MTDRDNGGDKKKIDSRLENVADEFKNPQMTSLDEISYHQRRKGAEETFIAMTRVINGYTHSKGEHYGLRREVGARESG
jgi:hypothetical protein